MTNDWYANVCVLVGDLDVGIVALIRSIKNAWVCYDY